MAEDWDPSRGAFAPERLLSDAASRTTLVGYLGQKPVGVVQMGPETGWISLACIRRPYRSQGYGVQLMGQAVQHTRPQGGTVLRVAVPEGSASRRFFDASGFIPGAKTPDGRVILEKDISFRREYLAE